MRHSTDHKAWAIAYATASIPIFQFAGVTGSKLMSYCTKHQDVTHFPGEGCTCASGTVRYFYTNHPKTSFSRSFNSIRRALGATPWQEGGDLQKVA